MRLTQKDPRVEKLWELCRSRGGSSLTITSAHNLYWLLGGRVQVGPFGNGAVCTAVITEKGVTVLTNNIEAARLAAEEFGPVPEIIATPWADSSAGAEALRAAQGENPLTEADFAAEINLLRSILCPQQQQEAEEVSLLASAAMSAAVQQLKPGMTEFEMSAVLGAEAIKRQLQPNVLFTAADEHICTYRHALNGDRRLKKTVMLSMGAMKNGLYASITRFVSFGAPDADFLRAQDITNNVAAMLYSITRPGTGYETLFKAIADRYAELGAPEQILLHHQGGMGGYQTRENRLQPGLAGGVHAGQLYAWNPSVTGFKSEDMLLVEESGNRLLTSTPEFPHKDYVYNGNVWHLPQVLVL